MEHSCLPRLPQLHTMMTGGEGPGGREPAVGRCKGARDVAMGTRAGIAAVVGAAEFLVGGKGWCSLTQEACA